MGHPSLVGPGESTTLTELKGLVGGWGKGTFETVANSIRYHVAEHGAEVGAKSTLQYLRKAEAFAKNLKGAKATALDNGATRYTKNGKYVILNKNKKILTFGSADY